MQMWFISCTLALSTKKQCTHAQSKLQHSNLHFQLFNCNLYFASEITFETHACLISKDTLETAAAHGFSLISKAEQAQCLMKCFSLSYIRYNV